MSEWTPDIVKGRFLEAADTEKVLPRPKPGTASGFWPVTGYTQEDIAGWDDAAKADNADQWAKSRKLTREAISRHEECMDWTIRILEDETRRHIVWAWARCLSAEPHRSFGAVCVRRGWVSRTAYRRLASAFERISDELANASSLLRLPDEKWLSQETEIRGTYSVQSDNRAAAKTIIHKPYRSEAHRDLIQSPDDADAFAGWLNRRNEREAKRRAKLGLEIA